MKISTEVKNAFNRQAKVYDSVAKVQYEIGSRLLERLDYLKIDPHYILDLGSGTGSFSTALQKKYPKAVIVSLDLSHTMLKVAQQKQRWYWSKTALVNAAMEALPFKTGHFDLIFSNQVIHWTCSMSRLMKELNRVLTVNGCLLFSTLGPDTFVELKNAWQEVDCYEHRNYFMDMHDLGDVLLGQGFSDPVVDMQWLTVHYSSFLEMNQKLKAQGVRNINSKRNAGMTGRLAWQKVESRFKKIYVQNNKYPLTYEVIFGHGWKQATAKRSNTEITIPVTAIGRSPQSK